MNNLPWWAVRPHSAGERVGLASCDGITYWVCGRTQRSKTTACFLFRNLRWFWRCVDKVIDYRHEILSVGVLMIDGQLRRRGSFF